MKIGDEVLIRDDHGEFTGRGILTAKGRGYREVEYSFEQYGIVKTVGAIFNSDDVKPAPKSAPATQSEQ